jgi:hypothetical protein
MSDLATTDLQHSLAPSRIGQATAVEQSRAIAEVQAAIFVAQQCPRNIAAAIAEMRQVCGQPALANKAFFRFPRGGQNASGQSVHLARELARIWGNVAYGVNELRRDDTAAESEMLAYAWDMEKNSRVSSTFIVPHKRDTKQGVKNLADLRDIYENNANNGARRLREAVFSVLPNWFIDEAIEICQATLSGKGTGKPLAQRVADAVAAFTKLGVTVDQLEAKLDRESGKWTEKDLGELLVVHGSLSKGEVTVEQEFPSRKVTAAELTGAPEKAANDG